MAILHVVSVDDEIDYPLVSCPRMCGMRADHRARHSALRIVPTDVWDEGLSDRTSDSSRGHAHGCVG